MISRLPAAAAVRLWDHVLGLVSFPVFADLKRSLGAVRNYAASSSAETTGAQEDWHGGSR